MRSPWPFWPKPITPCACQLILDAYTPQALTKHLLANVSCLWTAHLLQQPSRCAAPTAADVFSLNNPGLEGTRSSGLAPLFLPIYGQEKWSHIHFGFDDCGIVSASAAKYWEAKDSPKGVLASRSQAILASRFHCLIRDAPYRLWTGRIHFSWRSSERGL